MTNICKINVKIHLVTWQEVGNISSALTMYQIQVQAIWFMGGIHWFISKKWPSFHRGYQWSEKRLVLCSSLQVCTFNPSHILTKWPLKFTWRWLLIFCRGGEDGKYVAATWTIKFNMTSLSDGTYRLRLAIASATRSDLKVQTNRKMLEKFLFSILDCPFKRFALVS